MFVWGNLKTHNFKFFPFPIKNSKMLSEIITLHPAFSISNFKISEIWSLKRSLQNSKIHPGWQVREQTQPRPLQLFINGVDKNVNWAPPRLRLHPNISISSQRRVMSKVKCVLLSLHNHKPDLYLPPHGERWPPAFALTASKWHPATTSPLMKIRLKSH